MTTTPTRSKEAAAAVVAAMFAALVASGGLVQAAGADGRFTVGEVLAIIGAFAAGLVVTWATPITSVFRVGKAVAAGVVAGVGSLGSALLGASAGGSDIVESDWTLAGFAVVVAAGLAWQVANAAASDRLAPPQ